MPKGKWGGEGKWKGEVAIFRGPFVGGNGTVIIIANVLADRWDEVEWMVTERRCLELSGWKRTGHGGRYVCFCDVQRGEGRSDCRDGVVRIKERGVGIGPCLCSSRKG